MLASGIDVNASNAFGTTALMSAAFSAQANVVRALLAVPGILVNAQDSFRSTALMLAADISGNVEVVRALLDVPGIDVHARNKAALNIASNRYSLSQSQSDGDMWRAIQHATYPHRMEGCCHVCKRCHRTRVSVQ